MNALDYSGNRMYQRVKNDCKEGVQMVIKIDEQSAIATVLKNQAILLQRTIPYGIDDAINTNIKNHMFDVPKYTKALELDSRKTCTKVSIHAKELIVPDKDETFEDAKLLVAKQEVAMSFELLINGISRVMDYYSSRNGGEAIDKIYITGIGSNFSGLSKLLSNELGIKTINLKNLEGFNLEKSFKDGKFGEYIACMGAVIAPIGLVHNEKAAKGKKYSNGSDYTGVAYALLFGGTLIAAALIGGSFFNFSKEQSRYSANVNRLNELQEIRNIYAQYEATQNAYE